MGGYAVRYTSSTNNLIMYLLGILIIIEISTATSTVIKNSKNSSFLIIIYRPMQYNLLDFF